MGPAARISQEGFDEVVRENMEELGMDPAEAVQDAIDTLTLQGVDLSGIVTKANDPVLQSLLNLNTLIDSPQLPKELGPLLHHFAQLCGPTTPNAAIASRNGAVQLLTSLCARLSTPAAANPNLLISALNALSSVLHDVQSAETFHTCGGPHIIIALLNQDSHNPDLSNACFSLVATASTGTEILKESFVNLKVDQLIIQALNSHTQCTVPTVYDAIRVLLTADDNRVVASQVYGYARRFAKVGIAEALVESLHGGLTSPSLVSAAVALKAVVVNDEICRSVADRGGIDAILQCIDDSGEQSNKAVARTCCSLLCKLAGSDMNKSAIVEKGGMDRLIRLSARFSDDPSVIQEVMYVISVLSLRSPDHASRAMEAGAGDLAIQAMQKFPAALPLQRNACLMIRNIVVRNTENRKILLGNGIEKIIRKAKESHDNCKAAATDALRDLGLDNYNL